MTQEGGELTLENPFKVYRGLNRNIYIIFIGQVINSMGAFVFPFLTMFLTQKNRHVPC